MLVLQKSAPVGYTGCPALAVAAGTRSAPLPSCRSPLFSQPSAFLECPPWLTPLPPRLLLSGLKYQSLPYEVRRDTLAAPARQGNTGISSVFRVRISLSSSLSTLPSQINRRWRLPAHSFHTHEFPKTTLQWYTENLLKSVTQMLPRLETREIFFPSSQQGCCGQTNSLSS